MEKDVILTVFACSSQAPCSDWAKKYFEEEPIVITIPGTGSSSFRNECAQLAKSGDVFAAAVKKFRPDLKDIQIRNRCLVTFSAGWNFADELFTHQNEIDKLDYFILLDGCHTKNLTNWQKFANKAAAGNAVFIMAHTQIVPPFVSSTTTNTQLYINSLNIKSDNIAVPEYITKAQLDSPVTISLAPIKNAGKIIVSAIKKSWKTDPLNSVDVNGKIVKFGYLGNDRPDHVYVAWYVSERLWKWMGSLVQSSICELVTDKAFATEQIVEAPVESPASQPQLKEAGHVEYKTQDSKKTDMSFLQAIIYYLIALFSLLFGKAK